MITDSKNAARFSGDCMEAKRPPPRVNKGVQALADLHTPDRFDRLVLGGQLWCSSCQSSGSDGGSSVTSVAAPQPIPETFASVAEYVSAFEPYVLEEARESLRAEWAEQRDKSSGSCWAVEVASHEERPGGWLVVRIRASDRHGELKQRCAPGAVAVLSWARPPSKGAADWAAQLGERLGGWKLDEQAVGQDSASALAAASAPKRPRLEPTPPPHACAIAAGISRRTKERELELHFHPACPGHGARSCPSAGALSAALRGGHRAWWVSLAGVLVSSRREHEALLRVGELDPALRRSLLRPARLAELGRPFEDAEVRRRQWPSGARQPAFVARLQAQCDYTQLEAIEMAACHLGRDQTEGSLPHLPFILIQGPPGTGKTHTIVGVLNVWHLVAYQEYYHSLLQAMQGGGGTREAPLAERDDSRRGRRGERDREALPAANPHDILEHALQDPFFSRLSAAALRERPRLLVCAPSNAACDELARRVMRDGFRDGGGAAYAPNLVRVGAEGESAVAEAIRPRSIGFLVEQVAGLSQAEWQQRSQMASAKDTRLAQEIALLQRALAGGAAGEVVEDDGARTKETRRARPIDRASAGRAPVEQPDEAAPASSSDPDEALARRLIDLLQQQHRISHERRRLEAARALVWGAREEWQRRQAEREIETSFLSEAEMVFATLSSTQRRVFQEVVRTAPFATALVDEAGQASEVAALQALVCGASRAVLVGDPQQLPATVLSEAGRAALAGRSLFERLQAQGAPVKMLSVQYRMHPAIRAFPGGHFYGGRLRDAPSVVALADECFYAHPLLKPYVFFDVSRGREARGGSGGSLGNAAEAELAAALFAELRAWVTRAARERPGSVGAVSVGVITPYRQQRTLLRETFARMLSPTVAAEAAIETVDSFQGRQLDVVILSCVRAGEERGLGFVSDVRRLNVAITRARRALWILGSRARLRRGREWGALIQDAEERRCVVEDADARELFPAWEYWTKGADADGEQRKTGPAGNHTEGGGMHGPPPASQPPMHISQASQPPVHGPPASQAPLRNPLAREEPHAFVELALPPPADPRLRMLAAPRDPRARPSPEPETLLPSERAQTALLKPSPRPVSAPGQDVGSAQAGSPGIKRPMAAGRGVGDAQSGAGRGVGGAQSGAGRGWGRAMEAELRSGRGAAMERGGGMGRGAPVYMEGGGVGGRGTSMAVERGAPMNLERRAPTNPGRGVPTNPGRGVSANFGRGAPANPGRGDPVNPDRGVPVHPGTGVSANPGRGAPAYPGRAVLVNSGRGVPVNPGRGVSANRGRGVPTNPGSGVPAAPGRGVPAAPGRGVPTNPGRGVPAAPGRGVSANPGRGVPTNPGRGVPAAPGRGVSANPGRGVPANPGRGAPGGNLAQRDRGMDGLLWSESDISSCARRGRAQTLPDPQASGVQTSDGWGLLSPALRQGIKPSAEGERAWSFQPGRGMGRPLHLDGHAASPPIERGRIYADSSDSCMPREGTQRPRSQPDVPAPKPAFRQPPTRR